MPRPWGISLLVVVWSLAAAGVLMKLAVARLPRWLSVGAYLLTGWTGIVATWPLATRLPFPAIALLLLAGGLFSAGALCYATKRPNPFPRVAGHHELFHALQTAATVVVYVVAARYVLPA
jgi:hemolysin III